jgi:hypothetical protein
MEAVLASLNDTEVVHCLKSVTFKPLNLSSDADQLNRIKICSSLVSFEHRYFQNREALPRKPRPGQSKRYDSM